MAYPAGLWHAMSSITFCPIVGNAEHLAVVGRGCTALAPCGNMVSVHFLKVVDPALVCVVANLSWPPWRAFAKAHVSCASSQIISNRGQRRRRSQFSR